MEFMPSTMVCLCNVFGKNYTVASPKKGDFFLKREKKGRCFFRRRLKNSMYEGFTYHKEIYYINIHANS
jgi:hypothetical protein